MFGLPVTLWGENRSWVPGVRNTTRKKFISNGYHDHVHWNDDYCETVNDHDNSGDDDDDDFNDDNYGFQQGWRREKWWRSRWRQKVGEADFYSIVRQVSQSSCVSLSSLSSITGIPSGSTSQANSVKRSWICVRGKKLNRVSDYEKKNYPPLPRWIFFTVGNSEILRKSSEQHVINIANYG